MKLCIGVWHKDDSDVSDAVLDLDEAAIKWILDKRDKFISEQQIAKGLIEHVYAYSNNIQYYCTSIVEWSQDALQLPESTVIDSKPVDVVNSQIHIQEDIFYFTTWSACDDRVETVNVPYDELLKEAI